MLFNGFQSGVFGAGGCGKCPWVDTGPVGEGVQCECDVTIIARVEEGEELPETNLQGSSPELKP